MADAKLQVKICGITTVEQGCAIAELGASALGYICVPKSPRYVSPADIAPITAAVSACYPAVRHFGVFANEAVDRIVAIAQTAGLTVIQLHGDETPAFCKQLRAALSEAGLSALQLVKALRIRTAADLKLAERYEPCVDMLLLDAYHPKQLGGTGKTLDWQTLQRFSPRCPWYLAGGLNPDNIQRALSMLSPDGIDLSSGVERAPGEKDLSRVRQLFAQLAGSPC
ncbi:MAG: phosphoribosylanthranilate isomerase [Cyanobacteria bacterium J06614_10]